MLNVVALMGRLVADPEARQTPQGTAVCAFRIAVDRSFVQAGQQRQADFIDVVAWRQSAEFVCKYFQKGSPIAVEGRLQTRQYTDKNENKRTATEVVASQLGFVPGTKPTAGPGGAAQPATGYASGTASDGFAIIDEPEDLPF